MPRQISLFHFNPVGAALADQREAREHLALLHEKQGKTEGFSRNIMWYRNYNAVRPTGKNLFGEALVRFVSAANQKVEASMLMDKKSQTHSHEGCCENCFKPLRLCICDAIVHVETKTRVLILQHPQEPDVELGTARMANLCLPESSRLAVGLSWPNIKKAWGSETDPREWLVLYLGSARLSPEDTRTLVCVDQKGKPKASSNQILQSIKGLIVFDGTWSQAKALWWRNPWVTKVNRAILKPKRPSLYGKLRREPRRECVSTIESIGLALSELEKDADIYEKLILPFKALKARCGRK